MPVVARSPQRQNSAILAAAATNAQVNRALYSAVVPAFGLLLLVLALRKGFNSGKHSRSAYASIASLSILSGLVGSLGSHPQAEAIAQALLSLFLCIPVLHLTSVHNTTACNPNRCQFIVRTLLKSLLFISLSSATLFIVVTRFLTSKLPAAVYPSFPTTFFLAYSIVAPFLLISQLFPVFCRVNPATSGAGQRPIAIDIHIATRSAAVPINLAQSSCFAAAEPSEQYQSIQERDHFSIELSGPRHQKRPSVDSGISIISAFKPTNFVGSKHSCSNSSQGTDTVEFNPLLPTRDLLPLFCLLVAHLALCASYSCKLAFTYNPRSSVLEIIHNSLKVVSVMASMKAYLLHAYNTHLGSLGTPPNIVSETTEKKTTSFGYIVTPPIPSKSLASPLTRVLSHRLRVQSPLEPICGTNFNPAYNRPKSTASDHTRSVLPMTDSDEKEREKENGRLMNSFSVGSLKSAYGAGGSEESDQTRVESDTNEIIGCHVEGLEEIHSDVRMHQKENGDAYIDKGDNTPAPSENPLPKRLLGFGWLNEMTNRYRGSRGEQDFIDMGDGMKSSTPFSVSGLPIGINTVPTMSPTRGRDPRKLKRNITIASSFASMTTPTPTSYPPSAFTYACWNSDSTLGRSSSCNFETDITMGNVGPATPARSPTRKSAKKRGCNNVHAKYGMSECPDKRRYDGAEVDTGRNSRNGWTSSSGALAPKRSFKLDDGRTLSPGLTLAAAIAGEVCLPYANGLVKLPLVDGESNFGGCRETDVEVGHKLIHVDQNVNGLSEEMEEMVRGSHVEGMAKDVTEEVTTQMWAWEDRYARPPSFETPFPPRVNFEQKGLHPDSALVQSRKLAPKPHTASGKSREGPPMTINMNLHNVAQLPLEVSLETVLTPATSERPITESIPINTPTTAGRTTVEYPSTPSEPPSCSSSTTASPLVPERTPMISRSPASDHGHEQSPGPFQLARISSSPSATTQSVLRGHNARIPVTPTRGQSTFSSSSSSSSLRLSAVTIEGVKNAFSGVWSGKWSGRSGAQGSPVTSSASESIYKGSSEASTPSGMVVSEDDSDGDFMDLRDPFASPRKVRKIPSGGCGIASIDSSEDGHGDPRKDVLASTKGFRRKMNAWGRLPITSIEQAYGAPGQSKHYTNTYSLTDTVRIGDIPLHAKSKEHRRERRARKRIQRSPNMPLTRLPILDDVDFDVEEALLTQRLLKRLDDDVHQ